MKRILAAMVFAALMCGGAWADVEINETNFPDDNFRSYVSSNFDTDSDDVLSDAEISSVTTISVNSGSISSLQGVEYFTALTELRCDDNQLTALDVSNNTALSGLYCDNNQLTILDISHNTTLTTLYCYHNQLTELDVSNNNALTELWCYSNQLAALDVSNNTALTRLDCRYNQVTALDVSNNLALTRLYCEDNQLTVLDVSNNTDLQDLGCGYNQLTTIDVSDNTALVALSCNSNQLTELDVSNNTALKDLSCEYNPLMTLDVSNNAALTRLWVYGIHQLTSLDLSHNTALTLLNCVDNQLTELDLSNNTALTALYCNNNQLTALDLSNNTALTDLQCDSQKVSPLNITSSGNTSYPYQLDFSGYMSSDKIANVSNVHGFDSNSNGISTSYSNGIAQFASSPAKVKYNYATGYTRDSNRSMDVMISGTSDDPTPVTPSGVEINETNFPDDNFRSYVSSHFDTDSDDVLSDSEIANATSINVESNNISSLQGVEYFNALTSLNCSSNQLTTLNVSNNTALTYLNCGHNQLTALDVSENTAIEYLYCNNNKLTSLDVSKNTALAYLGFDCNQLTTIDLSKNTALRYLYCYENQLSTLDLSGNTALTNLYCQSQDISPLNITSTGNSSYPYQLNFAGYMTSSQIANVSNVQGIDASSNDISTSYSNGIALFASSPAKVTYDYATGYQSTTMDVTISGTSGDSPSSGDIPGVGVAEINSTYFPDATFRNYVSTNFDKDGNGTLSDSEVASVTNIYVSDMGISSLQGLESFTALTHLECDGNQLTALDISRNTALNALVCNGNQLSALNLDSNTDLAELHCGGNLLTSLDVSNNTALQVLYCFNNQLTTLDVSKNASLTTLDCSGNQLTALDVSHNPALQTLFCDGNLLTVLELSSNTALQALNCEENRLRTLDLVSNTDLTFLSCDLQAASPLSITSTGISSFPYQLDFSAYMTSAQTANVSNVQGLDSADSNISTSYANGIAQFASSPAKVTYKYATGYSSRTMGVTISNTSDEPVPVTGVAINAENFPDATFRSYVSSNFDTDGNGVLSDAEIADATSINVWGQGVSSMKGVEYFTALTELYCGRNQLTALDVSKNTALRELLCNYTHLTALDVSRNTALELLDIGSNDVTALNVSNNRALTTLVFGENKLTTLDVSNNTALERLDCSRNQLTALNVSNNKALRELNCEHNQLTALDISNNTALTWLDCYGNRLTALDVSNHTAFTYLNCGENQLTALDVSNNTALTELDCGINQLTTLNVRNNTALTELRCSANQLTALDVSNNTALITLYCRGNQLTALDVSNNTALTELYCYSNQLMTLDAGRNTALTNLSCHSQDISSPLRVSGTGNTSYPYQLDLTSYMTSAQIANVSDVFGVDSNGSNITTIYSNGIAQFTARPARVRYNYNTGYNSMMMGVTAAVNVVEYVNPNPPISDDPAPSHDARIRELLSLGYLDESYRPRVTFGGDGSDFTGTVRQGDVITRTVSLRFSAQTWNIYINGERISVPSGRRGTVETTALADGVTLTTNADGTSATITFDTKEFPSGSSNIELGVLPEGGTEETARANLGTITVSGGAASDVIEQAVITPGVLSDEVVQRLAQSVSVDAREIIMLKSEDIDPTEAPEPTQTMKELARTERYELAAKLNTIKVDKEGWYAFKVTISDDLVGTPVSDLRLYAADDSDLGGSFKAAFGFLPLINGIAGGFEVHDLLGIKLDSLPKQFIALMFLNASKSLTLYIAKILLMLLAGCASVSGIGLVVVVGMFAVRYFKKRR